MTTKQFWMKMDQVSNTKKLSLPQKEERIAELLKTAYEEDLEILTICALMDSDHVRQLYFSKDELHPSAEGNRYMLCYTGKNRAIYDTDVPLYPEDARIYHISVRDMLNNLFNKRVIGGLVFNRYLDDQSIIVRKSVLERIMPGEKPLPPNFKDAP